MTKVIIQRFTELLAKANKVINKKVPTNINRFVLLSDECFGFSRSIL